MDDDLVELRWLVVDEIGDGDWVTLSAILDPAEQERADRLRFRHGRQAYIAAHALVRIMLACHLGRPATTLRFTVGRFGRPEVYDESGGPPVRFNLSHTNGLVAAALVRRHDVGIDVEVLDGRRLDLDLAVRTFARAEADHLRRVAPTALPEAALAFWTLKEAYIKAIGLGLNCPLDSFVITLDPISIYFVPPGADDPAQWLFRRWRPTPAHVLALALRHERPEAVRVNARAMRRAELLRCAGSPDTAPV
jgi:4'-phosphopantetheinyl transferase